MKPTRLPELDGIRGCALLLVLVWHYIPCQMSNPQPNTTAGLVFQSLSLTKSGVDLFFVLSGFLIAGMLLDNREASNYFRVFYLRRSCRIFPVYFFLLGMFVVLTTFALGKRSSLAWLFSNPLPLWSYATFTQNVFMGLRSTYGPNWLGITWSLAVEEQFYCFIPLLIWLLPRKLFAALALLLVFLAVALRTAWWGKLGAFVWTPWRVDSLLIGALLAVAIRDSSVLRLLRGNIPILYAAFIGLLGGAVGMTFRPHAFGVMSHTWLAGLYGAFLLLAVVDRDTIVAKILRNRILQWFGLTSYGIYMYHQAISGLVHGLVRKSNPTIDTIAGGGWTLLALVLTLIAAALSYQFVERPILVWAHRFKYQSADATGEVIVETVNRMAA